MPDHNPGGTQDVVLGSRKKSSGHLGCFQCAIDCRHKPPVKKNEALRFDATAGAISSRWTHLLAHGTAAGTGGVQCVAGGVWLQAAGGRAAGPGTS
jgi:hypothetical protein